MDNQEIYREVASGWDENIHDPASDFLARLDACVDRYRLATEDINRLGQQLRSERRDLAAYLCFERAARDPHALGAQVNAGYCEISLGLAMRAEMRARRLLTSKPEFIPAWLLLVDALRAQGQPGKAAAALRKVIALSPDQELLWHQLAMACEHAGDMEAAHAAYQRAYTLAPQHATLLSSLVRLKRRICDWDGLDALSRRLMARVDTDDGAPMSPFDFLAEEASAQQQLACARRQAKEIVAGTAARPRPDFSSIRRDVLRVGFVSCGFGAHALTALTVHLFELLHGSAIEAHLYATGEGAGGMEQRRLAAAAHRFHQVAKLAPDALAARIQADGIEILFDLDGYSNHRKLEIASRRVAPIQVNWLGYPGTTGAPFTDYIIADRFVLPESLQSAFSEKVLYLPRCYLSTDVLRVIQAPPVREACGLPGRTCIVYACFNASFKLNPRSFHRMLRVLAAVPGSVLWLLHGPGLAATRLREAAGRMGVDPDRLVFMPALSNAAYLSRYRHADLFLDTESYGAHTTAADALWAGCPVLTRPGDTFATRVGGSLNHHLGLPELNVADDDEFVAVASRFGLDSDFRERIRAGLRERRRVADLFDMQGFARDFSALLLRLSEHYRRGSAPQDFIDDQNPDAFAR